MKAGLVSIIVPVYKVEKFLFQCLESISNQTYENIEVFLVNDGSPDNCPEICEKWVNKDERFYVLHQENKGVSAARNRALHKISGEYLLFVDSDDWLDIKMIESLVKKMQKNVDAVFCGYNEVDEVSGALLRVVSPSERGSVSRDQGVAEIFGEYSTMLWNKLFRTEILLKSSLFDEKIRIGEDELWMIQNLYYAKEIVLVDTPLYNYRFRLSGASKDYSLSEARLSEIESQKKVLEEIKKYANDELTLLAQKRMYYSCQKIMKLAFYSKDYNLFSRIDKEIEEVRSVWYSHHRNILGICRRKLVEMMMRLHLPCKLVKMFDR